MVRRILMIAYHFPPLQGSSGIQRTLGFAHHLPASGWQPSILSVHPRAYARTGADQFDELDPLLPVARTWAIDSARHLALRGRYPAWLALPDRWIWWWFSAVPAGLRQIRRQRPAVLWSSYPIATAHLIGLTLHRLTGIPWIADQRDPMTDGAYPADPRTHRLHRWIEDQIVRHSAGLVCTTPGAVAAYRQRYPAAPPERFCLIENGYDEDSFARAEAALAGVSISAAAPANAVFQLLHSGLIYPSERDPTALLAALATLHASGELSSANFQLLLRASGHDGHLRQLIAHHGLGAIVALAPPLPYRAALAEMLGADGLLLLQASNCNAQIPAKLYEYLRAGRPILALTDAGGDSAATLRRAGIDHIAALDSAPAIVAALRRFLHQARNHHTQLPCRTTLAQHSRGARTLELAHLLERVGKMEP